MFVTTFNSGTKIRLICSLLLLAGCPKPEPLSVPDAAVVGAPEAPALMAMPTALAATMPATGDDRLTVINHCSYPIWMEQQGMSSPAEAYLPVGGSHTYPIPAAGLASTRYWPKKGCNDAGENCSMGQSSAPCPANGCPPPVDSKLEATWGCTLANHDQCGFTPQHVRMIDTFWNSSAVDGYTFPYTIAVTNDGGTCLPVDCSALSMSECPVNENLSTNGKFPQYSSLSLIVEASDAGPVGGCFSPCTKLNYPTYGGENGLNPASQSEQMYCCPTPPISSPQCNAGPVVGTKYVAEVHKLCKKTAYAFAYDDGLGGRVCPGNTKITLTIGPNCP
jgi:hypothetical protein